MPNVGYSPFLAACSSYTGDRTSMVARRRRRRGGEKEKGEKEEKGEKGEEDEGKKENDGVGKKHDDVISLLMADPRTDLPKVAFHGLKMVIRMSNIKAIEKLWQYCPDSEVNNMLRFAFSSYRPEALKWIIDDGRCSPTADILISAIARGLPMYVKVILDSPRLNIGDKMRDIVVAAAESPYELFSMIMTDPRFDPSVSDSYALRYNSRYGRLRFVELLLKDPRVDPSARSNQAIRSAHDNGHYEVMKLLFRIESVKNNLNADEIDHFPSHF